MKKRQVTCAAFINFSKAYDRINRTLLWRKLEATGIDGKFINILKALYHKLKCSVKLNGVTTDWFDVSMGLKQGCILSPQLFNLFINDLTDRINDLKCGVKIGNEQISILLYADDIVLLSSNEEDLQCMLDLLYEYCRSWKMLLNFDKSKIVYFRPKSFLQTAYQFHCGSESIEVVSQYKYLGLILTEFLDYNVTTKIVS